MFLGIIEPNWQDVQGINNEASSAMDGRGMVQGCTTEPNVNILYILPIRTNPKINYLPSEAMQFHSHKIASTASQVQ